MSYASYARRNAKARALRFGSLLFLAYLVFALDQWTKASVCANLQLGEFRPITGFLNLCHVRNTGAAFSLFSEGSGWQLFFFVGLAVVISVAILVWLCRESRYSLLTIGLSLVLSGALGNVFDRITLGAVVDFLDFHAFGYHWPAFNVADIAICLGAFLVILREFLVGRDST